MYETLLYVVGLACGEFYVRERFHDYEGIVSAAFIDTMVS